MSFTEVHASEEPVATPITKRIARYDQYFDTRTSSTALRKTNKDVKQSRQHQVSKKVVLVVRRIVNTQGQVESTEIDIKSAALCQVLMEINRDVEGLELTRAQPTANSQLFFLSYDGLKSRLAQEEARCLRNAELIADLETAIQFVEEDFASTLVDFKKLATQQEITFDLLWALIVPNTLVYNRHDPTEQDEILLARSFDLDRSNGVLYANIKCDVVTDDGNAFGLAQVCLSIPRFAGVRKIQELVVYPLDYHRDKYTLRRHAAERGRKFAKMVEPTFCEISGQAMRGEKQKFHIYGRVMIDPVAFRVHQPNADYNLFVHKLLERATLTEEQYVICTPVVLGFSFATKTWGGFAMDRLRDVVWSDEAFRSLVIGPKQKTLIHSLVKQHKAHTTRFDDVIPGKGQGLIGLLSGRPGCGKTLTAEAVAEITHRPLYVISAGDLGIQPCDLDERLTEILELAQTWDAVLLLDEAEVFLQQRSATDVKRNALVSIFLRQLEYYQGILILTTNLLDQCDAAFESRIHFSIPYPDLDFEARKRIWKMFFGKATSGAEKFNEEDIDRLAVHEMNGRQIKNAISSAQCIALESDSPLSIEHVNAVLEVVTAWHSSNTRQLTNV
ncbi:AAA+-type ATPase [Heterobasidion irregulare TC 32-1]|uniref:AAA+-type ATPase n=1 Tax=Heterobasidion irregulare (strain TC 32-1) TaxID=747525 RepID=W4K364_HETIT|nr:AAA+-type ATPase [Heterobasidion irregulare TC 32-1]ETW80179.1 AAA+-type ATPase [Heterobasidion irregulare TC 32-1]